MTLAQQGLKVLWSAMEAEPSSSRPCLALAGWLEQMTIYNKFFAKAVQPMARHCIVEVQSPFPLSSRLLQSECMMLQVQLMEERRDTPWGPQTLLQTLQHLPRKRKTKLELAI